MFAFESSYLGFVVRAVTHTAFIEYIDIDQKENERPLREPWAVDGRVE